MSYTRVAESRAYDAFYDATYTGPFTSGTDARVLASMSSNTQVAGQGRYKYFRRPVMPRMSAIPPQVLLAPTVAQNPMVPVEVEPEPATKNAEIQTVYRDSEAQTNPYTPEYIVAEGSEPEVLLLKDLTFENGLPIGKKEIEMIEHARMKKLIESNLPPFTDEASMLLRKRLMEEQELREFKLRENEIDAKRADRLLQLQRALQERDEANEFMASQRVEAIRMNRMEEREKVLDKIRNKRIKVLRRLATQRNQAAPLLTESKKHDIIDDYFDKGSEIYAPTKRFGKEIKRDSNLFDVASRTAPLNSMGNILGLESSIPEKLLNATDDGSFSPVKMDELMSKTAPSILKGLIQSVGSVCEDRLTSAARRDLRNTKRDVEEMHLILQRKKREHTAASRGATTAGHSRSANLSSNQSNSQATSSTTTQKATTTNPSTSMLSKKPKGRPSTPDLTVDEQGNTRVSDRNIQAAMMLLQSLIRGRAIQNVMFEGKYRRRELIAELRDTDEYMEAENRRIQAEEESASASNEAEKEVKDKLARDAQIRSTSIESVGGGVAMNLMSLLSQEQDRVEIINEMQSFAKIAMDERRRVEASEGGRRQREKMAYPIDTAGV